MIGLPENAVFRGWLELPHVFSSPFDGVVWPAPLQQISFEGGFNQPIVGVVWPPSLKLAIVWERLR